jgi:long-chain acyl-CoA synthetase
VDYCTARDGSGEVKRGRKILQAIYQGYGATETCGGVAMCPVGVRNPPRSVGRLVPSKKVKLVDSATLEEVKQGEPGELLVSSEHMVRVSPASPRRPLRL